ncbi:MAG TPA: hypothetical protein VKT82_21595 [Ktedonobacterales bacterium]|nr:hypothetical protein [Ktedonobacterales bacterium]
MQQEQRKDIRAVMIGQRGGYARAARLTPEQRKDIASRAAWAKHHPFEFQRRKERAEQMAALIQQALSAKQMPLA